MITMLGALGFDGLVCNSSADICANDDFAKMGIDPAPSTNRPKSRRFIALPLLFSSANARRRRGYGSTRLCPSLLKGHPIAPARHYRSENVLSSKLTFVLHASLVQFYRIVSAMLRKPADNSYHRQLPTGTGVFRVVFTETSFPPTIRGRTWGDGFWRLFLNDVRRDCWP